MSLIVDDHRAYLSDPVRVDAFARAIAATVRAGDVVVDLGSGTGILGLLACRAGARRVYALETNGMIEIGRALARANGFADRFVFIQRHSTDAVLPEPADALVADMVGGMGFEVGIFAIYLDARRFMKPTGRMVPRSVTLVAAPVEEAAISKEVHFWNAPLAGFDMAPVLKWAANTGYPRLLPVESLLSDESIQATYDPSVEQSMLRLKGEVIVARKGTMHGIGGWFDAELAPGVRLTNAPRASIRLNRRNVFFPLERAAPVEPGDRVGIHIRIRPYDSVVGWDVTIRRGDCAEAERHSTLDGMLLSREEMHAQAPGGRPRLTPRGAARRTILELCDGGRTLQEIEQQVFSRHRDLFNTAAQAQAFVAEVVTRYGEQGP